MGISASPAGLAAKTRISDALAEIWVTSETLVKHRGEVAGSLIRRQERDYNLPRIAALAAQPFLQLRQWEGIPEMFA